MAADNLESVMEKSAVTNSASAMVADEFSRSATYTQPRSITIEGKYEGAPVISIWTGFAVQVVNTKGDRRIEQGPKKLLLDYDETLEVQELSTGKPKTTDKLKRTVYLRVLNNKVSDVIVVETKDHVEVEVKVCYRVNFKGDSSKWFSSDNYVKLLCDHARSLLKGQVKKFTISEFYATPTDIIRNVILGTSSPDGRKGLIFDENNMEVGDVDVTSVTLKDQRIAGVLQQAQHEVIQQNISLERALRNLEVTMKQEEINRKSADAHHETVKRNTQLEAETIQLALSLSLARIESQLEEAAKQAEAEKERQRQEDIVHDSDLSRRSRTATLDATIETDKQKRQIEFIQAEAAALVQKFGALAPGFTEALLAVSNNHTLAQIAEAGSAQHLLGGKTVIEILGKAFSGSPFQNVLENIAKRATAPTLNANGNLSNKPQLPAT